MRKLVLLFVLVSAWSGYSQENQTTSLKKNELKINAVMLLAGAFEVTYERLLDNESGVGMSLFASFDNDIDVKFSATPYYRFYFGDKPAAGFFAEGFGMLNSYERQGYNEYDYNTGVLNEVVSDKKIVDFALGFGIGGKWVTKKGIIFELNAGVGRNLFNSSNDDYNDDYNNYQIVGRGGVSIGYRFN
jgi:hypothetical protein